MNGSSVEKSAAERGRKRTRLETKPHVFEDPPSPSTSDGSTNEKTKPKYTRVPRELWHFDKWTLPSFLQWIPANWTWSNIKPVIRCAVAAWVSAVLFVIPAVERQLGQASFIILVAAFLSPPSDPFIAVLEREALILLFVTSAWAWSCLGMRLADLARRVRDPTVGFAQAISGQYIEAAPSVITAIFIFLGSAFFLYIKAKKGPGPYLFASVLSCLCLTISLTTSVLFPYPFYQIGKSIVLPLSFHAAIALLSSIFISPSSISAQYTTRLQGILTPLIGMCSQHIDLLSCSSVTDPDFMTKVKKMNDTVNKSEATLIPLAASARLLPSDLIYGRFAPGDFEAFHKMSRRIVGRSNGLGLYFTLIDPTRERFPITPGHSQAGTPLGSPTISRRPSIERNIRGAPNEAEQSEELAVNKVAREGSLPSSPVLHRRSGGNDTPKSRRSRSRSATRVSQLFASPLTPFSTHHSHHSHGHGHGHHHHHHHGRHHHHILHNSLLHLSMSKGGRQEHAVGVFESQRYMDLEATRLHDPHGESFTQRTTELLNESCEPLLKNCASGLTGVRTWLGNVRKGRMQHVLGINKQKCEKAREDKIAEMEDLRKRVNASLEEFRNVSRHRVLEPYRLGFESSAAPATGEDEGETGDDEKRKEHTRTPPHRYLFHCYVYQYHLMQFAGIIIEMLDEVIRLEKERRTLKLWTPVKRFFQWDRWDIAETVENDDDDDPDVIQGVGPATIKDLGLPQRRDPDALPPRNAVEWVMNVLYHIATGLSGGNVLFAIKAAVLTVILCLPSLIKQSAPFAYNNRFIWAIFMGQLTLSRFRGDTTFGLTSRVVSTFLGGIVGMIMWYISCGNGRGNPFGLAAVFAVCFPFFFYARLYIPGPPITNIIFFVTSVLVAGYSYQDLLLALPGSPGVGFAVAWRRFILVTVGVVAAFVTSFFPPSTTIRRYQRHLLATTSQETGAIYCAIISFAGTRKEDEIQEIITSLIAVRSKLKRSIIMKANITYEFSLRGRWPAERYQKVLELQMQLSYSLSHLMSVMEHLEPVWTRAFLRRTRFSDPDFQGDLLAVITMISTSIRTGDPLPQITPCPLLDRFLARSQAHGLDVIAKEAEEDFGLPRALTLDTLRNEQYMIFCVGVSTAFGIVNRLDRLMLATKEIVGEQYHIHGVGLSIAAKAAGIELGPRTSTVHFRPPRDV